MVCSFDIRFIIFIRACKPEILFIARMAAFCKLIYPHSVCLAAYPDSLQTISIGEIDIKTCAIREPVCQCGFHNLPYIWQSKREVRIRVMIAKRESDRGNPLQSSFYHYPHCSGVMYIYRRIISMVYASYNQVRSTFYDGVQRQLGTIHRSAVALVHHKPGFFLHLFITYRSGGSDGTRRT